MSKIVEHAQLHCHSHGSMLDGYATIPEYISRAAELGLKGMGFTDHGSTTLLYQAIKAANKAGITPIPGCEFYVAPINPKGGFVQEPVFYGRNGVKAGRNDVSGNGSFLHLTVLAVNNTGLKNLFALSSESYNTNRFYSKPRIDFELLEKHNEGLVVLSGCPSSEISTRFMLGQDRKAYDYADRLLEVFGRDRFFIEIMNHNMSIDLERVLLPKQLKLAKDLDLKLMATNDSHYALPKDHHHHEEMLCIQSGSRMRIAPGDEKGSRFAFDGTDYYLKSGLEMLELFPENDFPGAVSNTVMIAEMAQDIKIEYNAHLKPRAFIPEGKTEYQYFREMIWAGFNKRYGHLGADNDVYKEAIKRIKYELEVIHSSDFIGYFLVVEDYLTWNREKNSTVHNNEVIALPQGAGRGSVGGSVIAFCLGISEVCPIKHDLVFERFLSPGRGETYEIVYDDGSTEEILVSDSKQVIDENGKKVTKYIHELTDRDVIVG